MKYYISLVFCLLTVTLMAQTLLKPDRVFDGMNVHEDWIVLVEKNQITYTGPISKVKIPNGTVEIDLKGKTVLPGLIEGHSHILLHPYNETD